MSWESLFQKWCKAPHMDWPLSSQDVAEAPEFFVSKADALCREATSNPDAAFAELLKLVGFLNTVIPKRPDILDKLVEWIEKLKKALQTIAENKRASSFTISLQAPLGVSVSMSWNVKLSKQE